MAGFGSAFSTGIWKAHSISQHNTSLSAVEEWPSLDGMPPLPPPPPTLEKESSNLSDHGRELLNTALGFHEWQDIMQNAPPVLARSTSAGMHSQAPSGVSKLSRGTSEFTVDSTIHLRQRMNERVITKRELQAARKYGVSEYEENGAMKITHNSTTLIFDPKTHKGITAYPTKEEDSTVWAAVKTKIVKPHPPHDNNVNKNLKNQHHHLLNVKSNNNNSIANNNNNNNRVDMPSPNMEKNSLQIDSFTLQRFRDMGFEDTCATDAYIAAQGNFREAVESLLLSAVSEPVVRKPQGGGGGGVTILSSKPKQHPHEELIMKNNPSIITSSQMKSKQQKHKSKGTRKSDQTKLKSTETVVLKTESPLLQQQYSKKTTHHSGKGEKKNKSSKSNYHRKK